MALFEGNYEIHFYLDDFSDDRKVEFAEYIKSWGQEHPLGYDNWIENFDFNTFESVLWGGNDPENIEDMHNFLIEAAKAFPELEASGDGDGEDMASGSWKTKYEFSLKNGVLEWDEDEWSLEDEEEMLMKEIANKPIPESFKRNLKEIFPHLDESHPNGLIIEDGVLMDIESEYYDFLSDDSSDEKFYFPPEVESFDEDFDYFAENYDLIVEDFVITTNFKEIPRGWNNSFEIRGFENFYIIDADTKETVFYTNRFIIPDEVSSENHLYELGLLNDFADEYEDDQSAAIHNPIYGKSVDPVE